MVVFFCSTPYQIFLAINMKMTILKEKEADIFILNHFESSNEVVDRLRSVQLFKNVEHVDCINFTEIFWNRSLKAYFFKVYSMFFYKKLVNKYFDFKNNTYEAIYFTYPDVIIQLAIKVLSMYNCDIKIHLYEDGSGSYNSHIISNSIYKKIFNRLFNHRKNIDHYDSLMLLKPELYEGLINIPITKIPNIDGKNIKAKSIMNYVFDYKYTFRINEEMIFFDQPWNSRYKLHEKINLILEKILIHNYIIKLHPRSQSNLYKEFRTYANNSILWEVLCMNNSIEDKILISYYSTASFTSKLLFDKEPIVILLYDLKELPENDIISEDTKKFIEKFISTYRDQSKICIPQNINELNNYLKKLGETNEIT